MNKIQIVNLLLTRKCNLKCGYCAIVKDYENKPKEYPDISDYNKNEMNTEKVITYLRKLKLHNPDAFVILYGGEPFLRKDLPDIVKFCNENDINYTIISNCTDDIQLLIKNLFNKVGEVKGFSASIDPILYKHNMSSDHEMLKTCNGYTTLLKIRDEYKVKDLVAEVTVSNDNLDYLHSLIRNLSNEGINSDITFIDIAKSPYYDFSNITNEDILVKKTSYLRDIINSIISEKLNVHMLNTLLPKVYDILPSNLDCGIDRDLHDICVDADGSMRLCLRIRGVYTPTNINVENCFDNENNVSLDFMEAIKIDKANLCKKCNHTCYIMSEMISKDPNCVNDLVHTEIREK